MSAAANEMTSVERKLGYGPVVIAGPGVAGVVSGRVLVRGGAGTDPVAAESGSVVVLGRGVASRFVAREGDAQLLVFTVDEAWLTGAFALVAAELPEASARPELHERSTDSARRMRELLAELSLPARGSRPDETMRRLARSLELLSYGAPEPSAAAAPERRRTRSAGEIRAAVDALVDGGLDQASLTRLAAGLGVSERQASRLFREEFGHTFRDHMVQLRLARAKRMLQDTEHSIVQVAAETGWRSLGHFNAVFRRRVGATPSDFRRRTRAPARMA